MISEFSLFVFTTLGGVGAGLYAASAAFGVKGKRNALVTSLVPLVLLGIGGVALLLHLGHPERLLNAFANPGAGITLEAYGCSAFGVVLVADAIFGVVKGAPPRALRVVGGTVGVVLCALMGVAYFMYESVAVWHTPSTIALFLVCGIAAGFPLLGILCAEARDKAGYAPVCAVLAIAAAAVYVAVGICFATDTFSPAPFVCAAVLSLVGAGLALYARRKSPAAMHGATFAVLFVALVVARYAFYSVI